MRRHFIKLGDKTTAGGVVIEGEPQSMHHGQPLSYHGAKIYCHACKTTGMICNVPPYRPMTLLGKQVALENDICICKCQPAPLLIASQNTAWMSFESHELAAMGFRSGTRPLPQAKEAVPGNFDEQFVLEDGNGNVLANIYYTISLPSGELRHGTTDSEGRTARYQTNGAQNITIHLGHKQGA